MSCNFLISPSPLGIGEILQWFTVFLWDKHDFIQVSRSRQLNSRYTGQDVLLMVRSKMRGNLQRGWKPEAVPSDTGLPQVFHTWKDGSFQRGSARGAKGDIQEALWIEGFCLKSRVLRTWWDWRWNRKTQVHAFQSQKFLLKSFSVRNRSLHLFLLAPPFFSDLDQLTIQPLSISCTILEPSLRLSHCFCQLDPYRSILMKSYDVADNIRKYWDQSCVSIHPSLRPSIHPSILNVYLKVNSPVSLIHCVSAYVSRNNSFRR